MLFIVENEELFPDWMNITDLIDWEIIDDNTIK